MKTALPAPAANFIPTEYAGSPEALALAAALDKALVGAAFAGATSPDQTVNYPDLPAAQQKGGLAGDILGMRDMMRPESAPSALVAELGYQLSAPILIGDTDRQKRQKTATAVRATKSHGLWAELKPVLDSITAGIAIFPLPSASLYGLITDDWPVRVGDSAKLLAGFNWMVRGGGSGGGGAVADGIIRTGGAYSEVIVPGVVCIDLGATTAGQVTAIQNIIPQIVTAIKTDYVPAYYRIFLGYTYGGGFTTYTGGQIG